MSDPTYVNQPPSGFGFGFDATETEDQPLPPRPSSTHLPTHHVENPMFSDEAPPVPRSSRPGSNRAAAPIPSSRPASTAHEPSVTSALRPSSTADKPPPPVSAAPRPSSTTKKAATTVKRDRSRTIERGVKLGKFMKEMVPVNYEGEDGEESDNEDVPNQERQTPGSRETFDILKGIIKKRNQKVPCLSIVGKWHTYSVKVQATPYVGILKNLATRPHEFDEIYFVGNEQSAKHSDDSAEAREVPDPGLISTLTCGCLGMTNAKQRLVAYDEGGEKVYLIAKSAYQAKLLTKVINASNLSEDSSVSSLMKLLFDHTPLVLSRAMSRKINGRLAIFAPKLSLDIPQLLEALKFAIVSLDKAPALLSVPNVFQSLAVRLRLASLNPAMSHHPVTAGLVDGHADPDLVWTRPVTLNPAVGLLPQLYSFFGELANGIRNHKEVSAEFAKGGALDLLDLAVSCEIGSTSLQSLAVVIEGAPSDSGINGMYILRKKWYHKHPIYKKVENYTQMLSAIMDLRSLQKHFEEKLKPEEEDEEVQGCCGPRTIKARKKPPKIEPKSSDTVGCWCCKRKKDPTKSTGTWLYWNHSKERWQVSLFKNDDRQPLAYVEENVKLAECIRRPFKIPTDKVAQPPRQIRVYPSVQNGDYVLSSKPLANILDLTMGDENDDCSIAEALCKQPQLLEQLAYRVQMRVEQTSDFLSNAGNGRFAVVLEFLSLLNHVFEHEDNEFIMNTLEDNPGIAHALIDAFSSCTYKWTLKEDYKGNYDAPDDAYVKETRTIAECNIHATILRSILTIPLRLRHRDDSIVERLEEEVALTLLDMCAKELEADKAVGNEYYKSAGMTQVKDESEIEKETKKKANVREVKILIETLRQACEVESVAQKVCERADQLKILFAGLYQGSITNAYRDEHFTVMTNYRAEWDELPKLYLALLSLFATLSDHIKSTRDDVISNAVFRCDMVPTVIRILNADAPDEFQLLAAHVLFRLTESSVEHRHTVSWHKGTEPVIRLLTTGSNDAQISASFALAALVRNSKPRIRQFMDAGGMYPVIRLLDHSNGPLLAGLLEVCKELARDTNGCEALLQGDFLPVAENMFKQNRSMLLAKRSAEVLLVISETLTTKSVNAQLKRMFVSAESTFKALQECETRTFEHVSVPEFEDIIKNHDERYKRLDEKRKEQQQMKEANAKGASTSTTADDSEDDSTKKKKGLSFKNLKEQAKALAKGGSKEEEKTENPTAQVGVENAKYFFFKPSYPLDGDEEFQETPLRVYRESLLGKNGDSGFVGELKNGRQRMGNETNAIMVSYCHAQKDLVHQILRDLKEYCHNNRFPAPDFWLDMEQMYPGCSKAEAMGRGVGLSKATMVFISPEYERSTFCAMEANRARDLKKPVIPVKLVDYAMSEADSPIGLLLADLIYVDFGKASNDLKSQLYKTKIAELYRGVSRTGSVA